MGYLASRTQDEEHDNPNLRICWEGPPREQRDLPTWHLGAFNRQLVHTNIIYMQSGSTYVASGSSYMPSGSA